MSNKNGVNHIVVRKRFEDESIESMLKRLKRSMKSADRFNELKKREFYVRPGELKRQKKRRRKSVTGENL